MAVEEQTKGSAETSPKISAKEAALAAARYFKEITDYTGGVSIEELELSQDGNRWRVTLGYAAQFEPEKVGDVFRALSLPQFKKSYKVFEIDSRTGTVISMKIRAA